MDDLRVIWNVSIRRACDVLQAGRSTYQYKSRSASQAELRQRIKDIAASRVRYSYRRIHVLLRREGWDVNAKRVYRLYKEEGLQLRNKTHKRNVKAKLREGRSEPVHRNDVWAMDFVHDPLYDGRKIRSLMLSPVLFRLLMPSLAIRVQMLLISLNKLVGNSDSPNPFGWIMGLNLSPKTWTAGLTQKGLSWTSHVRANPLTMLTLKA